MSHFAEINEQNIVVNVIRAEQDFIDTLDGTWIQTSYNSRGGIHYDSETGEEDGLGFRKNFAAIGFTYDVDRDAFIPPQPYPSSVLDEDSCLWECPLEYPNDGNFYRWDEDAYQADNTQGWVLVGGGVE